ncbi:MAG: AEC family transporter [Pilosibacter sp.]
MSSVLLKAGCFFLIILMGYGLKKFGLLSQSDLPVFSKLVTKITLPAAIIHNFSHGDHGCLHAGDRADWFPSAAVRMR